jgi:hypothetical protein
LCVHGLEDLDIFIKNAIIKAEEEYKQINQIKKMVMETNIINTEDFGKNTIREISKKKDNNVDHFKKKNNFSINNYNYKDKNQYRIIDQKHFRNKNNSETKIMRHLSYNNTKEEVEKNDIEIYSILKDKRFNNKSLMNNKFYRNDEDSINNRLINTCRCTGPSCKNKNYSTLRPNQSGKINLYDFSKQKNYDYYINDYYNIENRDYVNEDNYYKNVKNNKVEIPHSIKNIIIYPYESGKSNNNYKNKSYNNIINFKKRELGLNSNIKNKIMLNLKEAKNKKNKK